MHFNESFHILTKVVIVNVHQRSQTKFLKFKLARLHSKEKRGKRNKRGKKKDVEEDIVHSQIQTNG
jgi:hypothetical protein